MLDSSRALPYWEANDKRSYLHHFSAKMDEYQKDLATLNGASFGLIAKDLILRKVEDIVTSLKQVLSTFLNGYPSEAYWIFRSLIARADLDASLIHAKTITLNRNHNFYRIKKNFSTLTGPNGFFNHEEPEELFHVRFEKRRSIASNRFSIQGFPSLYLSESLPVSWSECISKETDSFHTILFRNHRPLYVVDLVPFNSIVQDNGGIVPEIAYGVKTDLQFYSDYALLFPLIFACHSKFRYTPLFLGEVVSFKSEYIIPQLLLQWYREKNLLVDGLRYLSCTAVDKFPGENFSKYNYVIPIIENCEEGFCNSLLANYSASKVYSYITPDPKGILSVLEGISNELQASTFTPLYNMPTTV